MKFRTLVFACLSLALVSSCKMLKPSKTTTEPIEVVNEIVETPEIEEIQEVPTRAIYNASETRINDLIHTRLEVSFDYENQYLMGLAELKFKPYFYPTNEVVLDAKGFDINHVKLLTENGAVDLKHTYDGAFLTITLDKIYKKEDCYTIEIDYVAKPNELEIGGSAAITSDKGLYFINPLGSDPDKPTQIWTQGETESSSCWFPTIDAPNERMTQELFITVEEKYKTLSNGELVYSNFNDDGSRTDYWNMELPHAPYLAMMAIGEYKMALDKWENRDGIEIPVLYFIEDEFSDYVYKIFGNTPEMMTFYSNILNYDYPWSKYGQVIVRDYVSGAMENTTATVHGEFLNATDRELLDGDNEDIIAHELFHQWFGDLVTCENWANLPLNESFATYGEYLWIEYKYGKDAADYHAQNSMSGYFREAEYQKKRMIRFAYGDKEDMFDGHSYNKGGRILHMLRNYVGDEAFFASLNKYLVDNAYKSVEIHNLRLAFEEVTGEDLNWFFDQWFFGIGHPVLVIDYDWDGELLEQTVTVKQVQNFDKEPVFKLPFAIDIYNGADVVRHKVVIDEVEETFRIKCTAKPTLVNVDGDKMLLAQIQDNKPNDYFVQQYYNAPNYLDRYEAISMAVEKGGAEYDQMITSALMDKYKEIKLIAFEGLDKVSISKTGAENTVRKLVFDKEPSVRAAAINAIGEYYQSESDMQTYQEALKDPSYQVMAAGLTQIIARNKEKGLAECKKLENEDNFTIQNTLEYLYSVHGGKEQNQYFLNRFENSSGYSLYNFANNYGMYLANQESADVIEGLQILRSVATNDEIWWVKLGGFNALTMLSDIYAGEEFDLKREKEASSDTAKLAELDQEIAKKNNLQKEIEVMLNKLISEETDQRVLSRIRK